MSLEPGDELLTHLYKYRANNDRTLDFLRTRQMYFSFPDEFNDPFDCKLVMDASGSDQDIKNWLSKLPHPDSVKRVVFDQIKNEGIKQEILDQHEKATYKAIIVYCLSEKKDNGLMWSHYSSSHQGVCIGFKTDIVGNSVCIKFSDADLPKLGYLFNSGYIPVTKVQYSDKRPSPYNIFRGTAEDVKPFLLQKDKSWEYEAERRISLTYPILGKKLIEVDKNSISEVYLGSKIDDDFSSKVKELLRTEYLEQGFPIKVYSTQCSRNSFGLEFTEITP